MNLLYTLTIVGMQYLFNYFFPSGAIIINPLTYTCLTLFYIRSIGYLTMSLMRKDVRCDYEGIISDDQVGEMAEPEGSVIWL